MLCIGRYLNLPLKRFMSTNKTVVQQLTDRTLIRISGADVADYLQGLITNDMRHLADGPGCIYGMFLNVKGRVMYDAIVYRPRESDTYLIECDKAASQKLEKHLKMYRVRRKLDIVDIGEEYQIFTAFKPNDNIKSKSNNTDETKDNIRAPLPKDYLNIHRDLLIYKDPRVHELGFRILAKSGVNVNGQFSELSDIDDNSLSSKNYRLLRYRLGVGEGVTDLPPNNSIPLECNCDYLHGVSFHKGCYIGQELTARAHHTGVIRKRLMPMVFTRIPIELPKEDIIHEQINLGKFRGIEGNAGLALLRIELVSKLDEITIGDGLGKVYKPHWWPVEAPKRIPSQILQQ